MHREIIKGRTQTRSSGKCGHQPWLAEARLEAESLVWTSGFLFSNLIVHRSIDCPTLIVDGAARPARDSARKLRIFLMSFVSAQTLFKFRF